MVSRFEGNGDGGDEHPWREVLNEALENQTGVDPLLLAICQELAYQNRRHIERVNQLAETTGGMVSLMSTIHDNLAELYRRLEALE